MYLTRDDRKPPMTPQFALRVAILGGIALVMFSLIFFRLWYLEILSSDEYLEKAQNNQIREIKVEAPRGEILDRYGNVLVDNRTTLALQVQPQELPDEAERRKGVLEELSRAAGIPEERIEREIRRQTRELPATPVTLKQDVPYELVYYLQENQARLPGVRVERVYVRRYQEGDLGAHLFGYVGEVTAEELEEPRYEQLDPGDGVGKSGVEYQYDHLLRGQNGTIRVQVDALGRPKGSQSTVQEAEAGNNLRLTIDSGVQAAGEAAISSFGKPGAFVAMDVHTGEVLGLGSNPSFDPSIFSRPHLPTSVFEQLNSDPLDPLTNRAIQGLYPTGSTFKLITAAAALEEGLITPETPLYDGGSLRVGGVTFKNAGGAAYGTLALRQAIQVSSDVFFYRLGLDADGRGGNLIQNWAANLGLGAPTGIDLPDEVGGLIPTPEWRNRLFEDGGTDRKWSAGDNINLSVGQGDLQSNPLQMAVAYAAVANGGDVVRPHLGQSVEDPSGRVVQEIRPAPRRQLDVDPEHRQAILDGLHAAAMEPTGTSYKVFGGFPIDIAGKTGTAERYPNADQSWYVALAPYEDPRVVVAVTIEEGGFGADAAAPAAAQILSAYLDIKPEKVQEAISAPTGGSYD